MNSLWLGHGSPADSHIDRTASICGVAREVITGYVSIRPSVQSEYKGAQQISVLQIKG
jgi:hypothetical protein